MTVTHSLHGDDNCALRLGSDVMILTGLLYMYRYGIMRQSSKSLGTHGVCAKQFCTSISVCPMGDLIPCTCADIQVLQRALVALIRIAHGRRILRFIYAM